MSHIGQRGAEIRRAAVLVSLAVGLLGGRAAALEPDTPLTALVRKVLGRSQGAPSGLISDIAEAPDGSLWLDAESTLLRYDGTGFQPLDFEPWMSDVAGLANAQDGSVWLVTNRSAHLWDGRRMQDFQIGDGAAPAVLTIFPSRGGALWIGTARGLLRLREGQVTRYDDASGLSAQGVTAIGEDTSGTLWIGAPAGLLRLKGDRIEPVKLDLAGASEGVTAVLGDRRGDVWVGAGGALFQLHEGALARTFGAGDGLSGRAVHALLEDRDGALWIGTSEGGTVHRLWRGALESLPRSDDLRSERVHVFHEDREGRLWVAMGPLVRLSDRSATSWTTRDGLPDNTVWTVLEDSAGRVWAGTDAGLARLEEGTWTTFTKGDGLGSNVVYSLAEEADGSLLIGGARSGLARFDDGRFRRVPLGEHDDATVYDIALGPDGSRLLATERGLLRERLGEVSRVVLGEGVAGAARALHVDRRGEVWIGTGVGVRSLSGEIPRPRQALDATLAFREDDAGDVWGAVYNVGLLRYRGSETATLTPADGLPEASVYSLLPDGLGAIWMGSDRGILRVREADLREAADGVTKRIDRFRRFDADDGMQDRECNGRGHPSAVRARDGRLFFATMGGVAVIDPNKVRPDFGPRGAIIEGAALDGQALSWPPSPTPRGSGNLTLRFGLVSLSSREKSRIRYMLEGVDEGWVDAGERREAVYSGMLAGRYRFRVEARGTDDTWRDREAHVEITLLPRWYEDWLFRGASGALVLAGALGGFALLRARRARERRRDQQRIARQISRATAGGRDIVAPAVFAPGDLVEGRFEIVREIGSGGMGTVYEVLKVNGREALALKVRKRAGALSEQARLADEARLGLRVVHPNVVRVFEAGILDSGATFLVMELVRGPSLAEARPRFGDPARAIPLLQQIAEGLAAIHQHGIVHRDLKPSNVLLAPSRGRPGVTAKIADFGIAVDVAPERLAEDTLSWDAAAVARGHGASIAVEPGVRGTLAYVAPEIAAGAKGATPAADLYSFGVLASEVLRLPRSTSDVPPAIAAIVTRCLAQDPLERPSAREVTETLSSARISPIHGSEDA